MVAAELGGVSDPSGRTLANFCGLAYNGEDALSATGRTLHLSNALLWRIHITWAGVVVSNGLF